MNYILYKKNNLIYMFYQWKEEKEFPICSVHPDVAFSVKTLNMKKCTRSNKVSDISLPGRLNMHQEKKVVS